jgi:hypothetical protein
MMLKKLSKLIDALSLKKRERLGSGKSLAVNRLRVGLEIDTYAKTKYVAQAMGTSR